MVVILLLNDMEVLSVGVGALVDKPCMVFKECVCCACDPSVHLGVPCVLFVFVHVGSYLLI